MAPSNIMNKTTVHAVEPLNSEHIGGKDFVLCREVVLFRRLTNTTTISLVPKNVSIVERLSLFWRVLYRRFHYKITVTPIR